MRHTTLILIALASMALCSCWRDPVTDQQLAQWQQQADELSAVIDRGREQLPLLRDAAERAAERVREAERIAEQVGGESARAAVDRAASLAQAAADRVGDVEQVVADAAIGLKEVRGNLDRVEPGTPLWKAVLGTLGSAVMAIIAGRYIPGSQRLAWRIMGRPEERQMDAIEELGG